MRQLMSAICYIHARNILHTDIKPDNIMVERFDDKIQIKLIDFGTSELLSGGVNFARSFSGTVSVAILFLVRIHGALTSRWVS